MIVHKENDKATQHISELDCKLTNCYMILFQYPSVQKVTRVSILISLSRSSLFACHPFFLIRNFSCRTFQNLITSYLKSGIIRG